MGSFAEAVVKEINHPTCKMEELHVPRTHQFAFYKIGPVLSISVSEGESERERESKLLAVQLSLAILP